MPDLHTLKDSKLTSQQVALAVALLAAVIACYKLFGEIPAGALLVISSVVNLLLGRAAGANKGSNE